jgi:hypothetical protein
MTAPDRLLHYNEVEAALGVSRRQLRRLLRRHRVEVVDLGWRSKRVPARELDRLVREAVRIRGSSSTRLDGAVE